MSRCRVPTSFPQWPSHTLWCLLFKKANHYTMTTLNIRSDLMATWECAKQAQASTQLLVKSNACALHFKELKKTHIDRHDVHRQFAETIDGDQDAKAPPLEELCQLIIITVYTLFLVRRGMVRLVCHMLTCYV